MKVQKTQGDEFMTYEANKKCVEKSELMEELLAMVQTCFEGEAILADGEIRMRLPSGEAFVVSVENAA